MSIAITLPAFLGILVKNRIFWLFHIGIFSSEVTIIKPMEPKLNHFPISFHNLIQSSTRALNSCGQVNLADAFLLGILFVYINNFNIGF